MYTKRSTRSRKVFLTSLLCGIILILGSVGIGSPVAYAQREETPPPRALAAGTATPEAGQSTRYYSVSTLPLSNGALVEKHVINGPSVPLPGFELDRQPVGLPKSGDTPETAIGDGDVPAYVFGCSTTAAITIITAQEQPEYPTFFGSFRESRLPTAMQGLGTVSYFPNLYTGPTNGGVMPLDNSAWETWTDACGDTFSNNPLAASHAGVDGRMTPGTIDNYWVCYESEEDDPYITNSWIEHVPETLGDFMRTSQSAYDNPDGATSFYTHPGSARPLTCDYAASEDLADGSLGRKLFYESRGYAVDECYNQPTDNVIAGGFSLAQYKAEIDAGRPVMLGLQGHNVVGIGYDTSSNLIYIRDGWDYETHTMNWGGSYAGMSMRMVNMVNPIPPDHVGDYTISGYAGVPNATITYTGGSTRTGSNGYYSFSVAPGWSGTVIPSKPGYTFEPGFTEYEDLPDYQTAQNYTAALIPGANLVQDPGFEAFDADVSDPDNPYWEETSDFGTPLYEGEGAHTGSVWGWFGGTQQHPSDMATLSQTVTIPVGGSASLDFYFSIYEAAAGSGTDDVFTVKVDGTTVFTANATQIDSYFAYTPVSVDVTAYADGGSHILEFKAVTSGQVVAFFLDDVSLAIIPAANAAPRVLAITRLDSSPTDLPDVRFNVTFTRAVTSVIAGEFTLTTGGVTGAGITDITGSGASRTVTVNTGSGKGTIRLDVIDHDIIMDESGNPLSGTGQGNGNFNAGETYTLTSYVTKPALLSPKTTYVTNISKPTLDWSDDPSADRYELQLAWDSLFTQNEETYSVSDPPPFTFSTALADRRYYWRVQAYDSRNSPGGWSTLRYFTVDTTLPVAPTLRSPANSVTVRSVPIFRWSAVSDAVQYQFEIDNDENFSSPVLSALQRAPYRKPAGALRGTYFWHVRAQDAAGNWSAWSGTFTVNIQPRTRPVH